MPPVTTKSSFNPCVYEHRNAKIHQSVESKEIQSTEPQRLRPHQHERPPTTPRSCTRPYASHIAKIRPRASSPKPENVGEKRNQSTFGHRKRPSWRGHAIGIGKRTEGQLAACSPTQGTDCESSSDREGLVRRAIVCVRRSTNTRFGPASSVSLPGQVSGSSRACFWQVLALRADATADDQRSTTVNI